MVVLCSFVIVKTDRVWNYSVILKRPSRADSLCLHPGINITGGQNDALPLFNKRREVVFDMVTTFFDRW